MSEIKFWPEPVQRLLLRAAFMPGNAGVEAWEMWKTRVNMDDHLDLGSFRLLPQLYRNLQKHGVDDPLMMKFRGIARHTWYKNQRFFRSVLPLVHSLHEVGVESLLLDGPAIALQYLSDYVLDEGTDLAILVRPDQAATAIRQLQLSGCAPESKMSAGLEPHLGVGYTYFSQNETGRRIGFYWHVLPRCCWVEVDDDFWTGAVGTNIYDVPLHTLNPADQILHCCVSDGSSSETSLFVRAIDVMLVLNAVQAEVDWDRLIARAQRYRLVLPIMSVLSYLQDNLARPVPPVVWQRLKALPISRQEQNEYKFKTSQFSVWRKLSRLWFNYVRCAGDLRRFQKVIGFPRYLQYHWRLGSLWQVPLQAISATRREFRQLLLNRRFLP
jgi:hypothetical protein